MAARKRTWTPNVVRERIRIGVIARRLQDHALGRVEMTKTQVTAALGLLKKGLPDLSCVQHSGEMTHKHVKDLSDAELIAIASGSSAGAADEASGEDAAAAVH